MEFSSLKKNSISAEEDLKSGVTPQVKYSAVGPDINSNGITSIKATEGQNVPQPSQEILEGSNRYGEPDIAVLSKDHSVAGVGIGSSEKNTSDKKLSQAIVRISKPLCADYRSESDSESVDSESDSSISTDGTSDSSSESGSVSGDIHESDNTSTKGVKQKQKNMSLADLPPIEELKISVPEDACIEVGKISSIVDTLGRKMFSSEVVVESYKGSAALDIDTVLFLNNGKRSLGKVFDILGPISEPVYTVRFNNIEQIKSLNIEKEQKVYYAPKTQHTMFVFLSEILKNKGSDASWKDNVEAPSEFQDFSDDEEERLYKSKQKNEYNGENTFSNESSNTRKRSFSRTKQASTILQVSRLRHPIPPLYRAARNPASTSSPPAGFSYNVPLHPSMHPFAGLLPTYHHPRIAPPFPAFGNPPFPGNFRPFQQPFQPPLQHSLFFQHRIHPWGRQVFGSPPPPPPPSSPGVKSHGRNTDEKP